MRPVLHYEHYICCPWVSNIGSNEALDDDCRCKKMCHYFSIAVDSMSSSQKPVSSPCLHVYMSACLHVCMPAIHVLLAVVKVCSKYCNLLRTRRQWVVSRPIACYVNQQLVAQQTGELIASVRYPTWCWPCGCPHHIHSPFTLSNTLSNDNTNFTAILRSVRYACVPFVTFNIS